MAAEAPLLRVTDLSIGLPPGADRSFAVEALTFELSYQEILCIVGESGSGKSITAQSILGLLPPQLKPLSGQVLFDNNDLLKASQAEMRSIRGRHIAMIFQEPSAALDPVRTIGDQVGEMIRAHESAPRGEVERRVVELLAEVNLPEPQTLQHTYPFRLSGGQQQRVMIATALALRPSVLIADEPTTALDVTTQAQIIELIRSLQARRRMSVLFVTRTTWVWWPTLPTVSL